MKAKLIKYIVVPAVVFALFLLICIVVGAATVIVGNQSTDYESISGGLSDEVEAYRDTVEQYAEDYDISDYVDNLLCIM